MKAKLGEKNKFYYDENLKRWLEEGAEPPGDEPALLPPPTSASLQNRTADHTGPKIDNLHSNSELEYKSPSSEWNSGIPPIPPSSNHFSAHGRMGVRARYAQHIASLGFPPFILFDFMFGGMRSYLFFIFIFLHSIGPNWLTNGMS